MLVVALPLVSFASFVTGQGDAPFLLKRLLAWPGYMWLALLLYLVLALLLSELVRPLLRRVLARRAAGVPSPTVEPEGAAAEPAEPATVGATWQRDGRTGAGAGSSARDAAPSDSAEATDSTEARDSTEATEGSGTPDAAAPGRRLFVARTLAVGATTVAAATVGAGAYGVLNGPSVKRVTVPLGKLPRQGHGYRIAVVSDIHLGPILGRAHAQRVVDTINGTQPDMVAIVGDLVDGSVDELGSAAEPLGRLRSRHGSYFVTGNHEYFGDASEWLDHVRELGIQPLENARRELPHFDLAGVNDVAGEEEGQGPDFEKALGDRDTSRASVLLAHQPVQIHDAVDHDVSLQLSGHTHGGQLWPGNLIAGMANPTLAGLERYGDTQLYVSRGAGTFGPPVRVGAESDITVVTLASKQT
nr:metallophosphoesterase [Streptomyces oceani]